MHVIGNDAMFLNVIITLNMEKQPFKATFRSSVAQKRRSLSLQSLCAEKKIKHPDLLHSCCYSFVYMGM